MKIVKVTLWDWDSLEWDCYDVLTKYFYDGEKKAIDKANDYIAANPVDTGKYIAKYPTCTEISSYPCYQVDTYKAE